MGRVRNALALIAVSVVLAAAFQNNPTVDILRFRNGPTVKAGSGDPESSVTSTPGSLYLRTNGVAYRKATGSGNTGWTELWDRTLRRRWIIFWGSNTAPTPVGISTLANTGTLSDASDANSIYTAYTTASIQQFGLNESGATALTHTRADHDPYFYVDFKTGSDITDVRIWLVLTDTNITADDGGTANYIGWRFSTSASDTGWRGACSNGNSANQQLTSNLGTVAADTRYRLQATVSSGTVTFNMNGTTATLSTNCPTTVPMGVSLRANNLVAETKVLKFGHFYLESR